MATNWPRPPISLGVHNTGGSNSCIAAMIHYVYGSMPTPDPWVIDKATRRVSGTAQSEWEVVFHLLREDFYCKAYRSVTDRGIIDGGLEHIRIAMGASWNAHWAAYYAPDKMREHVRKARERIYRKRIYPDEYAEPQRPATPDDVRRHLSLRQVVSHTVRATKRTKSHKGLLVPGADGKVLFYTPYSGNLQSVGKAKLDFYLERIDYVHPVFVFWR